MQIKEIKKLYYSIGEVSKMTGIKQYVLRYWETEFQILNPTKNRAGNRTYRMQDINTVKHIKSLLYEQKFTIKGAKQYLADQAKSDARQGKVVSLNSNVDKEYLLKLKTQLEEAVALIEKLKD